MSTNLVTQSLREFVDNTIRVTIPQGQHVKLRLELA